MEMEKTADRGCDSDTRHYTATVHYSYSDNYAHTAYRLTQAQARGRRRWTVGEDTHIERDSTKA